MDFTVPGYSLCGVVWCGVVWCGVVWCGVVWCGAVWYRTLRVNNCLQPVPLCCRNTSALNHIVFYLKETVCVFVVGFVHLGDGSGQTIVGAATLRQKLQIKLAIGPRLCLGTACLQITVP